MTTPNPIPTQPETLLPCPWCCQSPKLTKIEGSLTNPELVACETDRCPMTLAMTPSEWNTRRAAVTAPRGDAWRPIESAPRNGAAILVGHERHGSRLVRWMISMAKDAPNGWWFIDGYDGPRLMWEPTHWMFAPALGDKTT